MDHVLGVTCLACGAERPFELTTTVCPACGGNVDVTYDYGALRRAFTPAEVRRYPRRTLWRYRALLPFDDFSRRSPLSLRLSPLVPAQTLGAELGLGNLMLKDEGRNPSGSLKDRASAVVLLGAANAAVQTIVGASTGNAGSSMACLAASRGQRCVIFVPATAPPAKVAQLLAFGATVVPVAGTYDQAFDLSLELGRRRGWYSRSTGFNPITREGKKTCALEIWEQCGFCAPDWVFVSVGDGNIISGLHKGFSDLLALGLIERLPRLGAVQAEGSAAVHRALVRLASDPGGTLTPAEALRPVQAETCADSISVDLPRDGLAAIRAVQQSGGRTFVVTDEEILAQIPRVARTSGIFGEPAGVASVAGLQRAVTQNLVHPEHKVVCVITGNGLKDVAAALKATHTPDPIDPTIEAAEARLGG